MKKTTEAYRATEAENLRLSAKQHAESLLPWFHRGSLDEDERIAVQNMLGTEEDMRADLSAETRLASEMRTALAHSTDDDADVAWSSFKQRLQSGPDTGADVPELPRLRNEAGRPAQRTSSWRPMGWTHWVMASQTVAMLALAFFVFASPSVTNEGDYQTLSSGENTSERSGEFVVQFAKGSSIEEIGLLLEQNDAAIVDGPVANGGYVISVSDGRRDALVEQLQGSDQVELVVSLESGTAQ